MSGPNGVGCPPQGAIQMQNQHGHTMTDQQVLRNLVLRYGSGAAHPGCNQAHGIYTSAPDAIVQNNIVVGAPTSAIQTTAPCGNVISNNVMINAQAGLILENTDLVGCPAGVPGHNTIVNNYVGNTSWHIFTVGDAAACTASTPNLISHNVSDGLDTEYKAGPFSCDIANSWSHQAGSGLLCNYKTDGSGDYRPKSGSIALKSGTTACTSGGISPCTPSIDFAGQSRSASISVGPYDLLQPGGAPDAPTGLIVTVN